MRSKHIVNGLDKKVGHKSQKTKKPSLDSRVSVFRITSLTDEQLLNLEKQEREVFADGGLNRWFLPVITRYGFLFSLKQNSQHLGLASFISRDKTAFLIGLWVTKDKRNKGLGNKLLSESLEQLKKAGITKVELTVDKKNRIAKRLYQRTGFKEIKRLDSFYGSNQPRILLLLNLVE